MDDKELELYPLPHLPGHRRRALGGSRSEWPICVATADKYLSGALDAAGFASDTMSSSPVGAEVAMPSRMAVAASKKGRRNGLKRQRHETVILHGLSTSKR